MAKFLDFAKENSDGWSLVAAQATIDAVAQAILDAEPTIAYAKDVPVQLMVDSKDEDGNYTSR